jgi:hypothetical protein
MPRGVMTWVLASVLLLLLPLMPLMMAGTARAQDTEAETLIDVDLQLVLAVDVSASIDLQEAQLQRDGYVRALLDRHVIQAIQNGQHGRIALSYIEWAGPLTQRTVVDWRVIDGPEAATAFAALLEGAPIQRGLRTSISNAILHAVPMFRKSGFRATRKVIDISGDGPNNGGFHVHRTRFQAFDEGITINGLPILNDRPSPIGIPATKNIDIYYEDCVIGGPGAFVVVAETLASFAAAVRRKLILEIAALQPAPRPRTSLGIDGIIPAQLSFALTDCTIGEKQFQLYRQRQNLKN